MSTDPNTDDRDEAPTTIASRGPRRPPQSGVIAERFGLLGLAALLVIAFSALEPSTFATANNWRVIGSSQAVALVIALALQIPLVAGHFDLSVGSTAVASAMLAAKLMADQSLPLMAAFAAVVLFCLLVGSINGLLVTVLRVDGLIATLGTGTILGGLVSWYSNQRTVAVGISPDLVDFGFRSTFGIPRVVLVAGLLALLVAYLQEWTPFGRRLAAIGSNPSSARLVGIPVDTLTRRAYLAAALLGGVAGILLLARQGSADPSLSGLAVLLPALAAVFLGTAAFSPGRFNVPGTIAGLALVAILVSGLTLLGTASWVKPVANGAALLVAVASTSAIRRRRVGA